MVPCGVGQITYSIEFQYGTKYLDLELNKTQLQRT